jgi:TonB family protein
MTSGYATTVLVHRQAAISVMCELSDIRWQRAVNKPSVVLLALRCSIVFTVSSASLAWSNDSSAPDSVQAPDKPKCKLKNMAGLYYPPPAIRLNQQGRVYIAYTIDKSGKVDKVKVIASEPADAFTRTSLLFLSALRCDVSKNWTEIHGPDHFFGTNFVYEFEPGGRIQPFEPKDDVVKVTASRIKAPSK